MTSYEEWSCMKYWTWNFCIFSGVAEREFLVQMLDPQLSSLKNKLWMYILIKWCVIQLSHTFHKYFHMCCFRSWFKQFEVILVLFFQIAAIQISPSQLTIENFATDYCHDLKTDIHIKGVYMLKVKLHFKLHMFWKLLCFNTALFQIARW